MSKKKKEITTVPLVGVTGRLKAVLHPGVVSFVVGIAVVPAPYVVVQMNLIVVPPFCYQQHPSLKKKKKLLLTPTKNKSMPVRLSQSI
mmetsp:Transcript_105304/g.146772  ORF Transcript_105304/g.146772 Transcript_105304/m.146772 type:complete len:88 (+) Transcript_105304:210-473(+)